MATIALDPHESLDRAPAGPSLDAKPHPFARLIFFGLLLGGFVYACASVLIDTQGVGEELAIGAFAFLALALVIALGFEFVNGFHDTANAVATVIYTNAMPASLAVIWSGFFNFLGVMLSSGAVAYAIITLLPVDLLLNVGSSAGFAMIFALLLAAVLWNLATWYVGLPNSSSHTLIGSVLGVGFANQLMTAGSTGGTSGVDWSQAQKVLTGLAIAPLIGFFAALLLLLVMRAVLKNPKLYSAPERDAPPPRGIRALLIFTCTAVSFSHGSNDGQKGMGLIMLILIGCAPTAYALNRTMPESATPAFVATADRAAAVFESKGGLATPLPIANARAILTRALQTRDVERPETYAALGVISRDVSEQVAGYGALARVPAQATPNLRGDMYLALDTSKLALKADSAPRRFSVPEIAAIDAYQDQLEAGTRFIPLWVKITVALALGLGTMVGWKRIVITVGEKIGKAHLTYGMGASAELVAACTILAADRFGLPVSTTHILSSGVAGAAVANGQGLQARTIRNMALAWVLTLPVAMLLSGGLYWLLLTLVRATGNG
ncbi:inorganic phosphate transporter [Sphingomonas qomolangmaensis]|uniref:Phosphate transporter n=1 Tax=Sphingomonas qomolangmaensis TaxID=2918765 RepID=A0ABY5L9R3_9SPHN|nr:inorganic phosphate transporter [Sphingomonas qomolangmaensis]UUL83710.1 inorganic phosphate transporter [Sphingomonas qomolangmaensis]